MHVSTPFGGGAWPAPSHAGMDELSMRQTQEMQGSFLYRHTIRIVERKSRWAKKKDGPFDLRGIARTQGALVVVRPDQYVAHVLPLDAHGELAAFFAGFMPPR